MPTSDDTHFRDTKWGMSPEQVTAVETATSVEHSEANKLLYTTDLLNFEAAILYTFIDDKLVEGSYYLLDKPTNPNKNLDYHEILKQALIEKYGAPDTDRQIWSNNTFRDDEDSWGTAVLMGHLSVETKWQLPATERSTRCFSSQNMVPLFWSDGVPAVVSAQRRFGTKSDGTEVVAPA